jgi:glutathione synthase/RimK-type ligase-like ATP-grasp enzyme
VIQGSPTIGVVTGVDRRAQVPHGNRRQTRLLKALDDRNPNCGFLEIDWRTIRPDGSTRGFDARARPVRLHLHDLDLLHVLRLGYSSRRNAPLREKWGELTACLTTVHESGVSCINAPTAVLAGIDKSYLLRLREMGFPVVPTRIVPSTVSAEELASLCPPESTVVKPLNGECGRLVRRLDHVDADALLSYRRECDHVVLQPFRPEIARGERSLVFIAGRFAHAVLKMPTRDFRANGRHTGARVLPYRPTNGEIGLGLRVGPALGTGVHVFRVDLISTETGPLILEVETVDPGHYAVVDAVYLRRLEKLYDAHLRVALGARDPSKSSIVLRLDRSLPIEPSRQR